VNRQSNPEQFYFYKEYRVEERSVPPEQASLRMGLGFGWAFIVSGIGDTAPSFALVIKSISSYPDDANIEMARHLGLAEIRKLIDSHNFLHTYYCYRWEPDSEDFPTPLRVDCDQISPGGLRSPIAFVNG